MKQEKCEERSLIECFFAMPKAIAENHSVAGLSHLVLYELGSQPEFNLNKIAYFVDNPDFDHFIGIGGFCRAESIHNRENMWSSAHESSGALQEMEFNKQVKAITQSSFRKKHLDFSNENELKALGSVLGMKECDHISWNMKHDNHGLLLYECKDRMNESTHNIFRNMSALLSFCPLF